MDALIAFRIKMRKPDLLDGHGSENIPDTTSSLFVSPSKCSTSAEEVNVVVEKPTQIDVLDRVKIRTTSAIEGILKDTKEKKLSFKKDELKDVEKRLKHAFVDFYHKLQLLQNYSYVNLLAFSKILKKYDKIQSRHASRWYMKKVDDSDIGSCNEVITLLEKVEATHIKHFSNSDRKEGMKLLRLKPKREKHSITFFSGLLSGCSIALLVALVLLIHTRNLLNKEEATAYMHVIYPLYSIYAFIILHLLVYASNVYFWRRFKINYPFIFGLKNGTELGYREIFLVTTGLAVFVSAAFLVHLHIKMDSKTEEFDTYIEMVPLGLFIAILVIIFFPFNVIYRSTRFFLAQTFFHCICAPFYAVSLPDFFMADQLTSQIQAIRCLEYYLCYYGWERILKKKDKCESLTVHNVLYYLVAIIPFWLRFLQCMRRLWEHKDMVHGYNSLRYFLTIAAVAIRTTYKVNGGTLWLSLTIASSGIATIASTYWDIVEDWGLLQRKSKNMFLRDKLMLRRKSIYFIAMVVNVVLRFAWLQLVSNFDMRSLSGMALTSSISCLEILRRGMWNFFRIENEHLYNVGRHRAFKSLPLPFVYSDDDYDDDKEN